MMITKNTKCIDIPKSVSLQANGHTYDLIWGCYNIQTENEKLRKMIDQNEKHYYLCILNWKLAFDIASPENTRYNKELLEKHGIDEVSANDIATYIYDTERRMKSV